MPLVDIATQTPIQGPPQAAGGDTGPSSTAVALLLTGRHTGNRSGFDPTDRCTVGASTCHTLARVALIVMHGEYPAADGPGPQFEQLATRWRPAPAGTGDV